ncbi:hypothetical protein ElyMa_004500800 [Elysia marginata]|uniref:Uncharacterized protein n=1 Tax=Elysia marginata TaxID=1093978 RepID=A0AAV4HKL4_9GAST|nr:hypothetical protein ElyMa_004500800 [Elysia marginata]
MMVISRFRMVKLEEKPSMGNLSMDDNEGGDNNAVDDGGDGDDDDDDGADGDDDDNGGDNDGDDQKI